VPIITCIAIILYWRSFPGFTALVKINIRMMRSFYRKNWSAFIYLDQRIYSQKRNPTSWCRKVLEYARFSELCWTFFPALIPFFPINLIIFSKITLKLRQLSILRISMRFVKFLLKFFPKISLKNIFIFLNRNLIYSHHPFQVYLIKYCKKNHQFKEKVILTPKIKLN
jgi:hypothetical protein